MSKDNSDYKKSIAPFKKNGNNNSNRPTPLEDKGSSQKGGSQKDVKPGKK